MEFEYGHCENDARITVDNICGGDREGPEGERGEGGREGERERGRES